MMPSPKAFPNLFPIASVIDDAKSKANRLSDEASAELAKASSKAQAKVGGIELYSAKYYATCTLGGIMACVSGSQYRGCCSRPTTA